MGGMKLRALKTQKVGRVDSDRAEEFLAEQGGSPLLPLCP